MTRMMVLRKIIVAKRRYNLLRQFFNTFMAEEAGQTLTEYALAVVFIGLAGIVILKLFPSAIRGYVRRIFLIVSLPIP